MMQACGTTTTTEDDVVSTETEIETQVELAEPSNSQTQTKVDQQSTLDWTQLGALTTHPDLRSSFDELLGITTNEDGTKNGILYTNASNTDHEVQNNTLLNAIINTNFITTYASTEDSIKAIEDIANAEYTDIEDNQGVAAVINAYFELLPDTDDGVFDGDTTLTRAQAMALVMRATTPVTESGEPESDDAFTSAVGYTSYTDYAAAMNDYAYLNTSNGLDTESFDGAMTLGEYICMLTKYIQANVDTDSVAIGTATEISSIANAGDVSFANAVADAADGVPSDMYKTLVDAVNLGLVEESDLEDWDTAITKYEAVDLFINSLTNLLPKGIDSDNDGAIDSYDYNVGSGDYTADQIAAGLDYEKEIGIKYKEETGKGEDYFDAYTEYAKSQGADNNYGAYFIYYNGQSAGSEPSYMIDPRDGTRYELGDDVPGYGTFCGTHDEAEYAANIGIMRDLDEAGIEYTYEDGILDIHY
jgi:hypothetical protein